MKPAGAPHRVGGVRVGPSFDGRRDTTRLYTQSSGASHVSGVPLPSTTGQLGSGLVVIRADTPLFLGGTLGPVQVAAMAPPVAVGVCLGVGLVGEAARGPFLD